MRYLHKLTGTFAATMVLLLTGGVLLAKPAPKVKKDPAAQTQPAKTVEAQVAKPTPTPAALQARPATRPANCPPCCRDCPLNQASAAPAPKTAQPSVATPTPAGPGQGPGPRWQQGGGGGFRGGRGGGGPPWMRQNPDNAAKAPQAAGDPKSDGRSPMEVFHNLLNQHDKIRRTVQEIPGGVFTVTTSADSAVAYDIKAHVWQMKARTRPRPSASGTSRCRNTMFFASLPKPSTVIWRP